MKKDTFIQIHNNKTDWWLETKTKVIAAILKNNFKNKKISILDIGSGTGFLASYLYDNGFTNITVSDRSKTALRLLNNQFKSVASINLPAKPDFSQRFDCILILDVLEHIKDDYSTLYNLKKLLKPNGKIIISVPAFEILWSKKDVRVEHYRRYSINTLTRVIHYSKFKIEYMSYYNFFLFFPALIYSLINKKSENISRYKSMPHQIFKKIFQLEIPLILRRFNFPFGVSILAIVKK